jgi:hypothetical protein
VLATVLHLVGKECSLYHEILKHVNQDNPKIGYLPFDWRFMLVI